MKRKSYDARVRAVYKRAVKAIGGGVTWRQICRVESGLAWSQRELLLDGDADPASAAGRSGRVMQVSIEILLSEAKRKMLTQYQPLIVLIVVIRWRWQH